MQVTQESCMVYLLVFRSYSNVYKLFADICLKFQVAINLKHSLLGHQSLLNKENFTHLFVFPTILFPEFRWGKLIGCKEVLHQASNNFLKNDCRKAVKCFLMV